MTVADLQLLLEALPKDAQVLYADPYFMSDYYIKPEDNDLYIGTVCGQPVLLIEFPFEQPIK